MTREALARGARIGMTAALGLVALAVGAPAVGAGGIGLRTGFSAGPGQWVFGVHAPFAGGHGSLAFVPSAEAGVGDAAFSLTAQGDVLYRFPHTTGPRPYVGLGGAAYYFNPQAGDSRTNAGLNLVGGVVLDPQARRRVLVDGRVRLTDRLPKARVVVGLEF